MKIRFFLILAVCLFISACGGGTSGTDNGGVAILKGQIVATDASKMPFLVTIKETLQSVTTSDDGLFEFEISILSADLTLEISNGTKLASVVVGNPISSSAQPGDEPIVILVDFQEGVGEIATDTKDANSLTLPSSDPLTDPLIEGYCDFSNPCPDESSFCNFTSGACGAADDGGNCLQPPEVCTEEYSPVCGCDGKTYSNACFAAAASASVYTTGECLDSLNL